MYAIIADGGRQYKVEEGQELQLDYRQDVSNGDELTFDQVLAVSKGEDDVQIGKPTVAGAVVKAKVLGPTKGKKIYIQTFRRRKNSKRRTGFRPIYTRVLIDKIEA